MKTMFRRMKAQRGMPFRTISLREVVSLKGSLRGEGVMVWGGSVPAVVFRTNVVPASPPVIVS